MFRIVWLAIATVCVVGCVPKPDPNHICSTKTLNARSESGRTLYYTSFKASHIPFVIGEQATLTVRAHALDRRGECIVDPRALIYSWQLFDGDGRPLQFSTNADRSAV